MGKEDLKNSKIVLKGLLSFPHITEVHESVFVDKATGSVTKRENFSTSLLIRKDDKEQIKKIKRELKICAMDFKVKRPAQKKILYENWVNKKFKDGALIDAKELDLSDYYQLSFTSKYPPKLYVGQMPAPQGQKFVYNDFVALRVLFLPKPPGVSQQGVPYGNSIASYFDAVSMIKEGDGGARGNPQETSDMFAEALNLKKVDLSSFDEKEQDEAQSDEAQSEEEGEPDWGEDEEEAPKPKKKAKKVKVESEEGDFDSSDESEDWGEDEEETPKPKKKASKPKKKAKKVQDEESSIEAENDDLLEDMTEDISDATDIDF